VPPQYTLDQKKGKGLVIMSLRQVNAPGLAFPPLVVNYRKIGDLIDIDNGLFADRGGIPIHGNESIRLHAFELDPGEYEFHKVWAGAPGVGTTFSSIKPFAARFKVESGRAVYAGMLEFRVWSSSNYSVHVIDRQDRDLGVFAENWRAVPRDRIDVKLFADR
jgi:hypothetical protein